MAVSTHFIQRGAVLRGINGLGRALGFVGIDPFRLDADALCAAAAARADWTGDVPAQMRVGLGKLIDSIHAEAKPNPFAKLAASTLFERTVYGRLKVEQTVAADETIEAAPLRQPVFIIGMPRTGTTILHALMHEDPAHRSPLAWECLLPDPVPRPASYADNEQLATVEKEFGQLFRLVPDFQRKHHMEADAPQECIGVNFLDFNSFQPVAQYFIPSYLRWFEHEADRLETMRWHRRFLAYLQSGGVTGERWLLKTPVHMMRLPELLAVYPDARIIMTHRHPSKVVASAASLISSVRSLYSDEEDAVRSGHEQAELWARYFARFMADRAAADVEDQIIDLRFEDFVSDQLGCVRRIYERFGWTLSDEAERRMGSFLSANPKGKHGKHEYDLADFDLAEGEIERLYAPYIQFLGGPLVSDEHQSKAALARLLDVIRSADQTFLDPDKELDAQGKVDGYQHLFHLLKTSVDFFLLNDPVRPSWMQLATEHHKLYGDNVDAAYYFTQLRGDQEYVIRGRRGGSCYLSFAVYAGEPNGEIVDRQATNINHTHIEFDEDGRFEIRLTPEPKGKNEFLLPPDAVNMFSREYFFDRFNSTESELSIENVKAPSEPPGPLDDAELARRIGVMSTFFEQTTWIAPLPVSFPMNDFLPPFAFDADQGSWGTVDNTYCFGRFRLAENEALEIRLTSPACCYWGVQTWNYLMQSMDYRHHPVCLNKGTTKPNDDGSYTILVSHRKPDHPNWISTAGYGEAIVFVRWLLAEELPEQPTARVITL